MDWKRAKEDLVQGQFNQMTIKTEFSLIPTGVCPCTQFQFVKGLLYSMWTVEL